MKIKLVKACSDLGVKVCGSEKGPLVLNKYDDSVDDIILAETENIPKEIAPGNKKRNINYVPKIKEEMYKKITDDNNFIITIGGDHSIAIGSALASAKKHDGIGILWIDAHSDYHNMESTISGNIHGMPLCSITGQNGNDLSYFFDGNYIDPKKAVIIGGRDIEGPEYINLKNAGVNLFTTDDIKKYGAKEIVKKTFSIIGNSDVHVSYDLDVIDPLVAPGVSVKAVDGINEKEAYEIMDELMENIDKIKSFDLVELNPDNDIEDKTKNIANNILEKLIIQVQKK
jgi:ornithine decarboxylase